MQPCGHKLHVVDLAKSRTKKNLLLLKLTLWMPVLLSMSKTDSKHDEHILDVRFRLCLVEVNVFSL